MVLYGAFLPQKLAKRENDAFVSVTVVASVPPSANINHSHLLPSSELTYFQVSFLIFFLH
jgi:hypothetical protein